MRNLVFLFLVFLIGCGGGSLPSATFDYNDSLTSNPDISSPDPGAGTSPGRGAVQNFKLTCEEAQFITTLNVYRMKNARSALKVSKAGVLASRWHAQNMIDLNYFSHSEPNGRDFSSRAISFGYGAWAENIAAGSSGGLGTFCQWKNSPGHNSNMLDARHRSAGIGRATGGGVYGTYWSSNFGTDVSDDLAEPLTIDENCVITRELPDC